MLRLGRVLLAGIASAGLLCACGGGSGDGSFAAPAPPDPTAGQLPITDANASAITGDVIASVSSLVGLVEITNVVGLPIPDTAIGSSLLHDSLGSVSAFAGLESVIVDTSNCDAGTFTTTWDDADDDLSISTGDSFDIAFTDCFLNEFNVTLIGDASVTNLAITGNVANQLPPWSLTATFGFAGLQGVDPDESVTISGAFEFSVGADDMLTLDAGLSGSSITAVVNGVTQTLTGFTIDERLDVVGQTLSVDANGTLTSSALNGSVSFETIESFVIIGDDNPSQGQMRISDPGSSVVVTVLDNLNVQLAIDADGDGIAETTLVVSWDDIDVG